MNTAEQLLNAVSSELIKVDDAIGKIQQLKELILALVIKD